MMRPLGSGTPSSSSAGLSGSRDNPGVRSEDAHRKPPGSGRTVTDMTQPTAPDRARVLVVDDEDSITQLVSTVLRYEGFEVETAADGRDAPSRPPRASAPTSSCST